MMVLLRKNISEKEARDFLLHARSLGNLKHPGILPIYDMGVIGGSFFYCYRPAPDENLTTKLKKNKDSDWIFFSSRSYRYQILQDLAATLAYAHKQGVSIGKLSLDSIVIGKHGEVVISDWTKSRTKKGNSAKDEQQFERWVQEDLKLLAQIGIYFYSLDPNNLNVSLSQWSMLARQLPMDLMYIFDRSFVGRPTPYANAEALQKDLLHHNQGIPIENLKGDFIATFSGLMRTKKVLVASFLVLCLISFFFISSMSLKNSQFKNEIKENAYKISRLENEKTNYSEDIKNISENINKIKEESKSMVKEIEWNQEIVREKQNVELQQQIELKQIKNQKVGLENKIKKIENEIKSLNDQLKKSNENKIASIEKQIDTNKNLIKLSEKFNYLHLFDQRKGELDINQYKEKVVKALNIQGWLKNYLLQQKDQDDSKIEYFSSTPRSLCINNENTLITWVTNGKIYIYDLKDKPKLVKFSGKSEYLIKCVFMKSPNRIAALSKTHLYIYEYNRDTDTLETQLKLPNEGLDSLIPYTETDSVASLKEKTLTFGKISENKEDKDVPWVLKVFNRPLMYSSEVIALPQGVKLLKSNDGISVLPRGNKLKMAPDNLLVSLGSSFLYYQEEEQLNVYKLTSIERPLGIRYRLNLITKIDAPNSVESILVDEKTKKAIVNCQNSNTFLYDFHTESEESLQLDGQPIFFKLPHVLLLKNKAIEHIELDLTSSGTSINHAKNFPKKDANLEIHIAENTYEINEYLGFENQIADVHQPDPTILYAFCLNKNGKIELWNLENKLRLDVISYHPELVNSKIYYDENHLKLYALNDKNKLFYW